MTRPIDIFPVHTAFGTIFFTLLAMAFALRRLPGAADFCIVLAIINVLFFAAAMTANTFFK